MLCNIETSSAVWVIVSAAKELAEYGVVPMINGQYPSVTVERTRGVRFLDTLWLYVPACEIILEYANELFLGVYAILRAKFGCTMMTEGVVDDETRRRSRQTREPGEHGERKERKGP